MAPPDAARQHQAREAALAATVSAIVRRFWHQVDFANLSASWAAVEPRATLAVAAGQLAAALAAEGYVEAALLAQGLDPAAVATLVPRSFAGVSSTGGDLAGLLRQSVSLTKFAVGAGAQRERAMAAGENFLDRAVGTQVADAGRTAVGTAIVARRQTTGYVRQVSPGACSRCIILAGRFYHWNQGFKRHPHCTCVHIPSQENLEGDVMTDPDAHFHSLSRAEQDATFGKAGAQALRDGADMGQVVNARSGMFVSADGFKATLSGRRALGTGDRLMPEAIYARAGSREEALALLRANGYIR
jgi:hypothetical protein